MPPTDDELRAWLEEYRRGDRSKSRIEREELDDGASHGKRITQLWRARLDEDTEVEHHLLTEVYRLREILDEHGIAY